MRERFRKAGQKAGTNGHHKGKANSTGFGQPSTEEVDFEPFSSLEVPMVTPPFPRGELPSWMDEWAHYEATATQTPLALAASVVMGVVAGGVGGKVRCSPRPGWTEPLNMFFVTALPPGERKTAVVDHGIAPVQEFEAEAVERAEPIIAGIASEHRMLEAKMKALEQKAAKAEDPGEAAKLRQDAKALAKELAAHHVPASPKFLCDDSTPEKLIQDMAQQGGRMLQASPEGTAFEIAKGRYSETANFDVYLKGHAGDYLRTSRISRDDDIVPRPALTCVLAVQPDVIRGLAENTTMRGRGFLARWLYSIPTSLVGARNVATEPVPDSITRAYYRNVVKIWGIEMQAGVNGKLEPTLLEFTRDADGILQDFERWLEPQLGPEGELSQLAGWANKLAGAAVRIAGIIHIAEAIGLERPWEFPVQAGTVGRAVRLARDYFLPHAKAAFGIMGADSRIDTALRVAKWFREQLEYVEYVESAPPTFSRRDIHQGNRRLFSTVEELDPTLKLLHAQGYIRPVPGSGKPGRGRRGPVFEVNPVFLQEAPRTQRTQRTQVDPEGDVA